MRTEFATVLCILLSACASAPRRAAVLTPVELEAAPWTQIVEQARGSEVTFAMWAGDDVRNRLFRGDIAQRMAQNYGVTLRIAPLGDTAEAINKLLNEHAAGKTSAGSIDVVWINGENFRTARQGGLLWGPFGGRLPNSALYDDAATRHDFGTPIEGYEAPWQQAQFVMAYDSERTPQPPRSIPALQAWIRAHPGRFTYIAPPDFTGSAFIRHLLIHYGQRNPAFWGAFDQSLYDRASAGAIGFLREIKPFLWRRGETYPATLKDLNRMFANREVDFAMSYSPAFASVLIERGEFPATARTFVFDEGTLRNYNYLAIPFNAANPAGAVVVINELMSPETMLRLSASLDQMYPHRTDRLSPEQRRAVRSLARGPATLSAGELDQHAFPEPDAQYLSRLEKDWLAKVLRP